MSVFSGASSIISHYLNGGKGDDLIYDSDKVSGHYVGGPGNDTIYGSVDFGRTGKPNSGIWAQPEIDWFTGGSGNDRFILFDLTPFDNSRAWEDPGNINPSTSSYFDNQSYGIITDFDLDDDKLFLTANNYLSKVNYKTKPLLFDGVKSTGIYASTSNQANQPISDDLVAVVHGISDHNFNINKHAELIGSYYLYENGSLPSNTINTVISNPFNPVKIESEWSTL